MAPRVHLAPGLSAESVDQGELVAVELVAVAAADGGGAARAAAVAWPGGFAGVRREFAAR